jgi:hypothetical protein
VGGTHDWLLVDRNLDPFDCLGHCIRLHDVAVSRGSGTHDWLLVDRNLDPFDRLGHCIRLHDVAVVDATSFSPCCRWRWLLHKFRTLKSAECYKFHAKAFL